MSSTKSQRSVLELKGTHAGSDIWVIAAGASMNFVTPEFFNNKITIGVNRVNKRFDCDYIVAKDGRGFAQLLLHKKRAKLILSRLESGGGDNPSNEVAEEHWVFDHPKMLRGNAPDLSVIGTDQIVVSYSTVTSALHLAAFFGAANIILCGHDCGAIDGQVSFDGYYADMVPVQGDDLSYYRWLGEIEDHTSQVIAALEKRYGIRVHSLNPFPNFNLGGHKFESHQSHESPGVMSSRMFALERSKRAQELEALNQAIRELKGRCDDLLAQAGNLQREVNVLRSSRSFRIGNAMLKPIRLLRRTWPWRKRL